jgi:hypothetical protein
VQAPAPFLDRFAFAVVGLLAAAFAHPVCDLFFRCGCNWLGAAHCNIHTAGVPHCPWCTTRWAFPLVVLCWLIPARLAIAWSRRRYGRRARSLAFGLAGLAAGMLASGAITSALR